MNSEDGVETAASPLPVPAGCGRALRDMIALGIPFALVGLLIGMRVVALATLPHILQPGEYVNFQEVVDGLPVPRLLAWNPEYINLLLSLHDLSGLPFVMACLTVFVPLWMLAVRRVNATFRLFGPAPTAVTPVSTPEAAPGFADKLADEAAGREDAFSGTSIAKDPIAGEGAAPKVSTPQARAPGAQRFAPGAALATPLEFYGLVKALTLLAAMGLPLAAVWILADFEDKGRLPDADSLGGAGGLLIGTIWLLRLALLGGAFWLGFHRDGIAGDFARQEWNNHARKRLALALRGALFGAMAFVLLRYGLPQNLESPLLRLQTLGTFNISLWNWFSSRCLLAFGAVGFGTGALFALFTGRSVPALARLALLPIPLAALGIAVFAQQAFTPGAMAARFDTTRPILKTIPDEAPYRLDKPTSGVPDGEPAAQQLAQKLRLPAHSQASGRTLILFAPNLPVVLYQNPYTVDGLAADAGDAGLVENLLRQRGYETALSWVAAKYLYNVQLMQFDTGTAIEIGLRDLTRGPHNAKFANTLQQMFAVCAATPRNQALLDQWADTRQFDFPDRSSRRLMGDLYRRMGRADKALLWYQKADMPRSFLKRVRSEAVMFHAGRLEGILRLNGKPLAGAQIAVFPSRMNGLPRGLETQVLSALEEILNRNYYRTSDLFPMWNPHPFSLRWVSAAATTDAQGAYHVDNLTDGAYTALCALPSDFHANLPRDNRLHIANPPGAFTVNYRHPTRQAGTTSIEFTR